MKHNFQRQAFPVACSLPRRPRPEKPRDRLHGFDPGGQAWLLSGRSAGIFPTPPPQAAFK